ncbi:class I adenylate-forming enzyme family protein [Leifsonia sp. NPDC080035]|uniref:Class I adenylate-forming enzyme family protein n=1 Tax=Leifsonia sp. NPDC080035 TaxID=3143936 RepID=A0AAU7GD12_9MICO
MIVVIDPAEGGLLERLRAVRAAGDAPLVGDPRWPAAQWDAVRATAAAARPGHDIGWATLTSGSSGSPRMVLRTEESWAASYHAVSGYLRAAAGGTVALPAPPASSLTLFSLAHALGGGPRPLLGAVDDAATCLHGTPQALRAVLDRGVPCGLRSALVGGSHLDGALRAHADAAGIRVTSYYGAAELSFVAVDEGDGLRAFPGVELRIHDGVLWVRSPYIAAGYARGDGSGPLRRDGEWASVGDRAALDGGRLRLLGRADDAILSASATIVPEEVEAVLRAVPGVRDVLVFGLPREPVGALVAALVEADGVVPLPELRAAAAARLSPAHRPRRWYAGPLPRTSSGKPARAEAARLATDGQVDRVGS